MLDARLRQELVIRTEDRVGLLAEICRLLGQMGINLLSLRVIIDEGITTVRLVTTSQSYALDALRDAGFTVEERDIVVVEIPHRPGFFCRIGEALARKDISIESLHMTVAENGSAGVVVFTCSDNGRAVQMLRGN